MKATALPAPSALLAGISPALAACAGRDLGITKAGDGWRGNAETVLCNSLDRADAMADEPADASVETRPTR